MSATVPGEDQPALRGMMLGRPHGRGDSGWPVEEGPSRYDSETNITKLHHTAEDKARQWAALVVRTSKNNMKDWVIIIL